MTKRNIAGCILTALTLSSFSTANAFEELGKVKLGPMERPADPVAGNIDHFLRNGKEITYEVVSVDGDTYMGKGSDGCEYSDKTWSFSPGLSWKNCNGSTGSHRIKKQKGSPWPMTKKTKFSFNVTGKNKKGSTWATYQKCKVKDMVKVRVPAGEFDTYKLVCSNDWEVKTRWISPELGKTVAIERKHRTNKKKNYLTELVKKDTSS